MEIFVRLFVWILNLTYGRRSPTSLYPQNPMDEVVLSEHEEESQSKKKDHLVEEFKSAAAPVQGTVDYDEMKWESFARVGETPEQFTFYSGRCIAKVVDKSKFSNRLELLTFRRMIRPDSAYSELLVDYS